MPRLIFTFQCSKGHETDEYVTTTTRQITCPECGEKSFRLISSPHFPARMGVDPDMPTMADKWAKMQSKKNRGVHKDANNDRYGGPRPGDV